MRVTFSIESQLYIQWAKHSSQLLDERVELQWGSSCGLVALKQVHRLELTPTSKFCAASPNLLNQSILGLNLQSRTITQQ